jgi:hypothetical protein
VLRAAERPEASDHERSILERRRRRFVEPALQPARNQPGQPLPLVPGDQRGELERLSQVDPADLACGRFATSRLPRSGTTLRSALQARARTL